LRTQPPPISGFIERLRQAEADADRINVFAAAAEYLDSDKAEDYEVAATSIAVAIEGVPDLARRALDRPDLTPDTRFLLFTVAAICCRRASDRAAARSWFAQADGDVRARPLFRHLEALTYEGGTPRELRRGLGLEKEAYARLRPHAGGAHAIASFLLQIAVNDDDIAQQDEIPLLREALDYIAEALETRPRYAKFFYTRGRIFRRLADYAAAREALLQAIEMEPRDAVDAAERVRDYRLELALVAIDQSTARVHQDAMQTIGELKRDVAALEERTSATIDRLKDAEVGVVTAVAFVAAAIALVQVTLGNLGDRPFAEVVGLVAAFGIILFGAVALGSAMIRRR
jgi:tetratricopeptide (TPR) repeat protein